MPGHYGDEEKRKKKKFSRKAGKALKKMNKGRIAADEMLAGINVNKGGGLKGSAYTQIPQNLGKMLAGVSSTAKKKDPYSKPTKNTKGLLTKAQEVVSTDEVEKRSQLKKRKIKARTEKIDAKTKKIKAKTKKVKAKNALKAARRNPYAVD